MGFSITAGDGEQGGITKNDEKHAESDMMIDKNILGCIMKAVWREMRLILGT